MVFWLFKKNIDYNKIKKEVEGIHGKLHHSFSNIKKDMQNLNAWLEDHEVQKEELRKELKSHKTEVTKQFNHLQLQIDSLHSIVANFQEDEVIEESEEPSEVEVKEVMDSELPVSASSLPNLETLTQTQKMILHAILAKLSESGRKWCSLKEIAEELYPEKEYHKVRPTISAYLNHIEEMGITTRKRVNKEAYITITDFGNKVIKNLKDKKEEKVKAKITK